MNLLVYYNQNQKNFYIVYTNHIIHNYFVGYENSYGHMLVQILYMKNKKFYNILGCTDILLIPVKRESLKSRLAKRAMRWLNKYRE